MRRLLSLFISAIALSGCAAIATAPSAARVITYNVRLDTDADGANAWPHRRSAVVSLLRFYSPDIFGLQEVQPHQLQQLKSDLQDYEFLGVGRDDGREAGEHSPIAVSRDRFRVVEHGTFWLSETPQKPSRGFDAAFPRLVTWARLEDRRGGSPILALNTHWDHVGVRARLESALMVRSFLDEARRECESVLFLGDLNATPEVQSYQVITAAGATALFDARRLAETPPFGPYGTFNAFDIRHMEEAPIDHIFVGEGIRVIRYGVLTQHQAGRLPSDHYPVLADVETPRCAAENKR